MNPFDEAKKLQAALAKLDRKEALAVEALQGRFADARLKLESEASETALRLVEAAKDGAPCSA